MSRVPLAFPPAVADRSLVDGALAASHVARQPVPPDASYSRELLAASYRVVADLIERAVHLRTLPAVWYTVLAIVGLAALFALGAAAQAAIDLWRGGRAKAAPPANRGAAEGAAAAAPGEAAAWDADGWRAELDRCLSAGQVHAAMRALWWWLARSLAGPLAEPTWTGRELLSRTRRDDLRSLVRRLDALTYGPRLPAVDEVRQLRASLEAALA